MTHGVLTQVRDWPGRSCSTSSASGTRARAFAHDAYGSRTCDTARACAYPRVVCHDANRPVRVQQPASGFVSATYGYDAFGRKVAKTSSTGVSTLFFYDPAGHLLEQLSVIPTGEDYAQTAVWLEDEPIAGVARSKEAGTPASLPPGIAWALPDDPMPLAPWLAAAAGSALLLGWLPAPRRPRAALVVFAAGLASQSVECTPPPAGSFFWIHTDHLGAPIAMSDTPSTASAAKVVWRAKYEPFGKAAPQTDPDGDGAQVQLDLRLPGQIYDSETGLHYNYFRTYDPRMGRYLEADPIGQAGGINRYAYADLTPLGAIDPTGRSIAANVQRAWNAVRHLRNRNSDLKHVLVDLGYWDGNGNPAKDPGNIDSFFHCLGACEASSLGEVEERVAAAALSAREVLQGAAYRVKELIRSTAPSLVSPPNPFPRAEGPLDREDDEAANKRGLEHGRRFRENSSCPDCKGLCLEAFPVPVEVENALQ